MLAQGLSHQMLVILTKPTNKARIRLFDEIAKLLVQIPSYLILHPTQTYINGMLK